VISNPPEDERSRDSVERFRAAIRAGDHPAVIAGAHHLRPGERRNVYRALDGMFGEFHQYGRSGDSLAPGVHTAYELALTGAAPTAAEAARAFSWTNTPGDVSSDRFEPAEWAEIISPRGSAWRNRFVAAVLGGRFADACAGWLVIHEMVVNGLAEEPADPRYTRWVLVPYPWVELPDRVAADPTIQPLLDALFRTPEAGLHLGVTLSPMECKKRGLDPRTRPSAIADDAWRGLLDAWGARDATRRPGVINNCLTALGGGLPVRDAIGFVAVHRRLDVTVDELADRQQRYVSLLASPAPATVVMAHDQVRRLIDSRLLEPDLLIEVSTEVLLRPEKGAVREHLRLLTHAVRAGEVGSEDCAHAVVAALDTERNDLTVLMARLLVLCAQQLDAAATASLRAAVAAIVPEPGDELRNALGVELSPAPAASPASSDSGLPKAGTPPMHAEPPLPVDLPEPGRLAPIRDVDTLAELVSHLIEDPSPPAEVERALDGMARLRDLRPTVAEALRNRYAPGSSGIFSYGAAFASTVRAWAGGPTEGVYPGIPRWRQVDDRAAVPQGVQATAARASRPVEVEGRTWYRDADVWQWYEYLPTCIPEFLLYRRMAEIRCGKVTGAPGGLLATPDSSSGTISGDEFLARVHALGAAGRQATLDDASYALLRIEPAGRADLLRRGSLTPWMTERLLLLARDPTWHRATARLGGEAYEHLPAGIEAAVWQSVDAPHGAADDPVRGWLDTRSVVQQWAEHDLLRTYLPATYADLTMWAHLLPSDPDVVSAHLQPELTGWIDASNADLSGVLGALGCSRRPLGGPTLSAFVWAAGFRNARTAAAAAEAIATAAQHGTLSGADLGTQLLAIVGPGAGTFPPAAGWGPPSSAKISRIANTLADAARINNHAELAVLDAIRELLAVLHSLRGGVALLEIAAGIAERRRIPVELPPGLAALASGRSASRTAQEARRLAAAGRATSG
jgi:hypothetical protein